MTHTAARTRNEPTTVMLPQYRMPDGSLTDVPAYHTSQDVHDLIVHRPNYRGNNSEGWEYVKLRNPQTNPTAPMGAKAVVVLKNGVNSYASTGFKEIRNKPWWNHMMRQQRQAFVVWGDRNGVVFNSERSLIRASNARGVIFSRYPVFSEFDGRVTDYRVKVLFVEFQLLTKQPERGETLRYKVDTFHFRSDEPVSPYGCDAAWRKLVDAAKSGFERNCDAESSGRKLAKWSSWFFNQKAQSDAGHSEFKSDCRGIGWLAALDSVTEAWQLPIALSAYSSMFPEVPPQSEFDSDVPNEFIALHPGERYLLERGRRKELLELLAAKGGIYRSHLSTHLIMPRYEGSRGSMEGALMEAYLRLRPHRQEQFEQWMADYVYMTDGFRNYTGD